MISCIALERPGKWRPIGVVALLLFVALPTAPLLWQAVASVNTILTSVDPAFGRALRNSAWVGLLVAVVSFTLGLPAGVWIALYAFPGRRMLTALVVLPLPVPSFLWSIGWSSLAAHTGLAMLHLVSGFPGCIMVFSTSAIPIVLLTSYAAAAGLSQSQIDTARLAGGEKTVVVCACRHVAIPGLLAAGLGGVLTLSDPGPGQILGLRTAASEVLTSFSALYDFTLAGQQCAVLAATVLVVSVPIAWFAAPRLASEMLARQFGALRRVRDRGMGNAAAATLAFLVLVGTIAPGVGLALPLIGSGMNVGMWKEIGGTVGRTTGNTLIYAVGAGVCASALGLLLAFFAGRDDRLRTACLGISLALFSLPPAFAALGVVQIAAAAPAWADPMLRSRLTVCVALGLRFFPVASVLGLRAWGSTSASWAQVAAIHGVSLAKYLWKVAFPFLLPVGAVATLLVALLATADVGTVLPVHPPGEASFPLAIFTVMANAPEFLVSGLCLVYVAAAGALLRIAWTVGRRRVL